MSGSSVSESSRGTGFKPRRLGHVNLYVGNVEAAMQFYVNVCGLEDVFRERQIKAGFVSNGRGHHDLGMVEVAPRKLIGRNGEVLGDRDVPDKPGLNHLAFEVNTEADLVEGFRNIRRRPDVPIDMVLDHGLAHSIYLKDPAGSEIEFYSDTLTDWRTFWNDALAKDAMVTGLWDPEAAPGCQDSHYDDHPTFRVVEHAPLHPVSVLHATMVIPNFETAVAFYSSMGFEKLPLEIAGLAAFKGYKQDLHDVVLAEDTEGAGRYLHHVTFGMPSITELDMGAERIRAAGISVEKRVDSARKSSIFIRDPDGLLLEFAFYRSRDLSDLAGKGATDAIHLL